MMVDLLAVPLKKPTNVDLVKPLNNTINIIYSSSLNVDDYIEQVNGFNKLRNSAVWKSFEKCEDSLEVIYSYYDELIALEDKIPPGELQIPFKWKNAFIKGSGLFSGRTSLTVSLTSYERVCVLFNIAALQSFVASSQSTDSDDGLKLAAQLLQRSAGIFNHLKGSVTTAVQQEPTPDLIPDTLESLSALMLAQAQEIFVHKAIRDNMKEAIMAKVTNQAEDLYAVALKLMQKDNVRPLWDKEWISVVSGKQALFQGMAEFYQSLVCKSNKAVGEEIARLQSALEFLKAVQVRSGKPTIAADVISKAQQNLTEAMKDNDFVYHERVPERNVLQPIGRAALAKALPLGPRLSNNFKDLFEQLVPMAVHQTLTSYEIRKNELVNSEVAKLRDAKQLINSALASMNLPAALEDSTGEEFPQSLVAKALAVQKLGGILTIKNMLEELPQLFTRNKDILDEIERMLNDEKLSDDDLRERFRDRLKRTPSERLTDTFRSSIQMFHVVISNATQSDKIVRDKYYLHKWGIEMMSESPSVMAAPVPHSKGSMIDKNSSSADRLRALIEQVESIKAERFAIECKLKSATIDVKSMFLTAFHDGSVNEPTLSLQTLGRTYGPLQQQVKEILAKQEALLADIHRTNKVFVAERSRQGKEAQRREEVLKELASAHDAYMELKDNLKEGTIFYNDLTQSLVALQNKIADFCFARKTEKEELLKELTRGHDSLTSNVPQHHAGTSGVTSSGRKEPTIAPPANAPANPPYPMQPQNMPQTYPQYVMPIPGYYTLPFPSGYQPSPSQDPGYPPPQYPGYTTPSQQQNQKPQHSTRESW